MSAANRLASTCLCLAGLNGFIAVAAGAYGRHAVSEAYPREIMAIASHYQLAHALALLALAWLAAERDARWLSAVGFATAAFSLGILLFSGTLYALALSSDLPAVGTAPAGGFLLMAGWLTLVWIGGRALLQRR
ncbi:MAG: DUF423 domain-containing protein [Rhodospirillales bacterium]|nr:DUF423 domain-containing protein [Rhodospirillales bacterium]